MPHPDEGLIHAWLDGALSESEGAEIQQHAAGCPECSATIAEARGLIAASSRIVSQLDGAPGAVIPIAPTRKRRVSFRWPVATLAAAGLIFAISIRQRPESASQKDTTSTVVSRGAVDSAIALPAAMKAAPPKVSPRVTNKQQLPPTASTRAAAPAPLAVSAAPMPAAAVAQEKAADRADQPILEQRRAATAGSAGIASRAAMAPSAASARREPAPASPLAATQDAPRFCAIFSMDAAVEPVPSSFGLVGTPDRGMLVRAIQVDQQNRAGPPLAGLFYTADHDTILVRQGARILMTMLASSDSFSASTAAGPRRGTRKPCD